MMTLWSILKRQMRRRARASHETKVSDADGGVKTLRLPSANAAQTHSMFFREKNV